MRHALITTHLLNQARAAIAQAAADERLEHQTRTQPTERGRLARVVALARRVRSPAARTT
jgi:hypothetical protein